MQPIRTVITALLAAGLASIAYARPPALAPGHAAGTTLQQDEPKPQQDEQKPKETDNKAKADKQEKSAKQQDAAKSQKQEDQKQDKNAARQDQREDRNQDKSVARQDQREDQKQDRNVARQDQREDKGSHGRIPDRDFKAHFGQEHKFSVRSVVTTTTIVPNQTRFVYSGYTFVFVDPWPAGWAMGDDCYIDYVNGGYFIFDLMHPGVQIALTIVA